MAAKAKVLDMGRRTFHSWVNRDQKEGESGLLRAIVRFGSAVRQPASQAPPRAGDPIRPVQRQPTCNRAYRGDHPEHSFGGDAGQRVSTRGSDGTPARFSCQYHGTRHTQQDRPVGSHRQRTAQHHGRSRSGTEARIGSLMLISRFPYARMGSSLLFRDYLEFRSSAMFNRTFP